MITQYVLITSDLNHVQLPAWDMKLDPPDGKIWLRPDEYKPLH